MADRAPGRPRPGPEDELYVGYLPQAPPRTATFARRTTVFVLTTAVVVAMVLVVSQAPFGPGWFEFGVDRPFEGVVHAVPYPVLAVDTPAAPPRHVYLVGEGKHGASEAVALDGHRVALRGSLLYRDDQTMVEVRAGTVEDRGETEGTSTALRAGTVTLQGEIVDAKCFLGLMKPGAGKPHRACAARCISGGVPPIFLVRTDGSPAAYLLLADIDGSPVGSRVLGKVAEPLEITGELERRGDLWILLADPVTYRRTSR